MPTISVVRIVVAACYLTIYAGVFAVAWQGRHGVGGGMAFTAPIMLGFPWAPLMVIAATLSQKAVAWPREFAQAFWFIGFFVVPPVLNVLTILFAGRRRRTAPRTVGRDSSPSGHRRPEERGE